MSSNTDDTDENLTPPDILETATKLTNSLLPEKSRKAYDKCYQDFITWKMNKKANSFSENVLLAYFQELSDNFKCSSLWSKYSMIKSTLSIYNDIDITKYSKLVSFLKRKSQGYKGKKAKTFSAEHLNAFLNEAPDKLYLSTKVEGMRAHKIPATLLLLLFAIEALDANRRKQKEKYIETTTNICDISDRDSKVHCYCEFNQEINQATKTECWVFNGGIDKSDQLWTSFSSQSNIETLAFNVRADGGLDFIPNKVFRYLRNLKYFSVKFSSIPQIETSTFHNLTSLNEITLTKNKIMVLSKYAFNNLPNLTMLTMDENMIRELVTDTFYEVPNLRKLYLTSNNITNIQNGAFRHVVNLLELELDRNNISELRKECFDGLANLKRLDLRKNKLTTLNSLTFTELWNLQSLLLDYNEINFLAQRTFDGLSQLKKLTLSHNNLVTLTNGLFEGVRGLSALDLRHNKLQRFTSDNLRPIYDNLKGQSSYIYLEGNDFNCDCHLEWMHQLRHDAKSIKVRTSLENFVCKFDATTPLQPPFTYYERNLINSNNLYESEDKSPIKEYVENTEDILSEESDDSYVYEPNPVKRDNERTLLQIPKELLPCPQEIKSVTDRTYTYPSQNEAKDYRNLIPASKGFILDVHNILSMFPFLIMFV